MHIELLRIAVALQADADVVRLEMLVLIRHPVDLNVEFRRGLGIRSEVELRIGQQAQVAVDHLCRVVMICTLEHKHGEIGAEILGRLGPEHGEFSHIVDGTIEGRFVRCRSARNVARVRGVSIFPLAGGAEIRDDGVYRQGLGIRSDAVAGYAQRALRADIQHGVGRDVRLGEGHVGVIIGERDQRLLGVENAAEGLIR